jgi:hypothetical protein
MNRQQRKLALAELTKRAALNKIAEEAIADVNEAGVEDPDQFADRVFQELLKNISIDGLED